MSPHGRLDAGSATRIAGYHLTALRLLAADPDAAPAQGRLLSDEEIRLQFEGFAGPVDLPNRRFHELFEDRARPTRTLSQPSAATGGGRTATSMPMPTAWTSAARARPRPEGVVAVVSERDLEWMAAVLAIFKAGGVYLPVEPHLPADRIAAMLARAGCQLVLNRVGRLGDARARARDAARRRGDRLRRGPARGPRRRRPRARRGADQLAYIYFTSGSTGEPKGAMCEHGGMLNHLYAKIDDLEIREGDVVAQTAPQSFDISLWQLVSGLLVGGRTLIVEQELILDIEGFVERINDRSGERAAGGAVLPRGAALLPRGVPASCPICAAVSVTGEPVKKELLRRWFAFAPGIAVMNAYGLTETSDDTNHEVMTAAPDSDRVPLGRAVRNVRVYVVDEQLVAGAARRTR